LSSFIESFSHQLQPNSYPQSNVNCQPNEMAKKLESNICEKNVGQINVHCGQLKHANEMGICEGKTRVGSHILVVFIL